MNRFIHPDSVFLSPWGKRSKLLFNIIKIIIISFTYANPGRIERALSAQQIKPCQREGGMHVTLIVSLN